MTTCATCGLVGPESTCNTCNEIAGFPSLLRAEVDNTKIVQFWDNGTVEEIPLEPLQIAA